MEGLYNGLGFAAVVFAFLGGFALIIWASKNKNDDE